MYIERKTKLVQAWGFRPVSELLFKRDSEIATELWSVLDADTIQILDKNTNIVEPYTIDWSLFN